MPVELLLLLIQPYTNLTRSSVCAPLPIISHSNRFVGRGDGCGCWSRSLDRRRADTRRHVPLGGGGEASGTHSLRSRGDRDCDYDRGRGADRRYFREGHFLVAPSPQASPTNYNLIYIAGSPGPLYLDGRDGGLRRVQRTSLPRR